VPKDSGGSLRFIDVRWPKISISKIQIQSGPTHLETYLSNPSYLRNVIYRVVAMLYRTTFDTLRVLIKKVLFFEEFFKEQYLNNRMIEISDSQRTSTKRRRPLKIKISDFFNKLCTFKPKWKHPSTSLTHHDWHMSSCKNLSANVIDMHVKCY